MRAGVLLFAVVGCTGVNGDVPPNTRDMRVEIPDADPRYIDIVTPDVVIQPGEEKMLCYHTASRGAEAVRGLGTRQGAFGHHIGVFTTFDPQPEGTLEDCSGPEANAKLRWFVVAFEPLPTGYAIDIPDGTPYVMQFHYINPSDEPILVRDVARLLRAERAADTTWVSTLIATDLDLSLPFGPTTRSWDCTIAEPQRLMIVSGHMHELGTRFTVDLANGGPMQRIYDVAPWRDEFRDTAPVTSFYGNPLQLHAGATLRTTCSWENPNHRAVGFPAEMCTLFAYAAGTGRQLQCEPR